MAIQKTDLIALIASTVGSTKVDAAAHFNATLEEITKALKSGESITIIGFGTFTVVDVPARDGRNPQTGAPLKIKAHRKVKFKSGKGLKDTVN